MHFDTTGTQSLFVLSATMSLFSRYTKSLPRSLIEAANQPDAAPPVLSLSSREVRLENSNSKHTEQEAESE